jgi:DnaA family protein
MTQLTLPVTPLGTASFAIFDVGGNGPALTSLRNPDAPMVFLWGQGGSGKTHLLQALSAEQSLQRVVIVDLEQWRELVPAMLEGLEQLDWVCIDNLDAIAGRADWEEALFDLSNRVRETGARLRVAAGAAPRALSLALPDLVSRLEWGPVFELLALDDAGRARALALHAEARGLVLLPDVQNFLLRRAPRDNHALLAMLQRLDQSSLVHQRRLTIPFVKQVLGL